mmetsp:Transcript_32786/g.50049  ORF Transcript_32786/g.50049 Transcript_32786/m.50049 type:complete len:92 (-) Transcript_32786:333-608(-)
MPNAQLIAGESSPVNEIRFQNQAEESDLIIPQQFSNDPTENADQAVATRDPRDAPHEEAKRSGKTIIKIENEEDHEETKEQQRFLPSQNNS